jgi:hypothetical protein
MNTKKTDLEYELGGERRSVMSHRHDNVMLLDR